jgi:hypothetical protein
LTIREQDKRWFNTGNFSATCIQKLDESLKAAFPQDRATLAPIAGPLIEEGLKELANISHLIQTYPANLDTRYAHAEKAVDLLMTFVRSASAASEKGDITPMDAALLKEAAKQERAIPKIMSGVPVIEAAKAEL